MSPRRASYKGLLPASARASAAARGASRKSGTRCEVQLRRALFKLGLRYRTTASDLPGKPDIVFRRAKVAVFCDGDFWHGRDLEARVAKLARGHNAPYWLAKIRGNVERDRQASAALAGMGWVVLRFWETDIAAGAGAIAGRVAKVVREREAGDPGRERRAASAPTVK